MCIINAKVGEPAVIVMHDNRAYELDPRPCELMRGKPSNTEVANELTATMSYEI